MSKYNKIMGAKVYTCSIFNKSEDPFYSKVDKMM